jgi:hypothetical protein
MAKKRVGIYIAMMVGDDMKVFPKLRLTLRIVHGNCMTKVIHLNYLRFKFISVKKQLTWSIHEDGVLTSFLRQLRTNFGSIFTSYWLLNN